MRIYTSPQPKKSIQEINIDTRRESRGSTSIEITTDLGAISLASLESKDDTFVSALTEEELTVVSDAGTEVTALRGWLEDFGNQSKSHYQKNHSKPDNGSLTKPTRPKVGPKEMTKPPTPLPPPAAQKFNRRLSDAQKLSRSSNPARIKTTAPVSSAVQATNEGYAPVSQLTQWLANDPTSKKKVVQLRRGANVISKSRVFDKGLANVIIEQNHIKSGSVLNKADMFNGNASDVGSQITSTIGSTVSDKKEWLKNVFQSEKAKSDDTKSLDDEKDMTAKAKEMWRSRTTTPAKKAPPRPSTCSKNRRPQPARRMSCMPNPTYAEVVVVAATDDAPRDAPPLIEHTPVKTERRRNPLADHWEQQTAQKAKPKEVAEPEIVKEEDIDFHAARRLLVQRSKKNGNDVEVLNKVRLRKNKFERIEKDNLRKSMPYGMLKPSWSEDSGTGSGHYVKEYVEDYPDRKSVSELP